jgi:hypothetical protein
MGRGSVSDNFEPWMLLAAAPLHARWDDRPTIPLNAAPYLLPLSRWAPLPRPEGP